MTPPPWIVVVALAAVVLLLRHQYLCACEAWILIRLLCVRETSGKGFSHCYLAPKRDRNRTNEFSANNSNNGSDGGDNIYRIGRKQHGCWWGRKKQIWVIVCG